MLPDRLSTDFPSFCVSHRADATIKSANKPLAGI